MEEKHLTNEKVLGMIPARYASSRFPGKILAQISGKSLIQRTYENASRCKLLTHLVVATDDLRIYEHVKSFGGDAVITSCDCPTGTDRLIEALKNEQRFDQYSVIINIQGDEPCIDPKVISKVGNALLNDPESVVSTAVAPIDTEDEANSRSVVKCVLDCNQRALYFSRSLIPAGHAGTMKQGVTYYRHIGIYGYRRQFLLHYGELPQTPLQKAEDLEQLKILENGFRIKAAIVEGFSIGVDMPEDIGKVEQWLCKQNISSSPAASVRR